MEQLDTRDPIENVQRTRARLSELSSHLRSDLDDVEDPRARALFETSAEVLDGLARAFEHFSLEREPAWSNK